MNKKVIEAVHQLNNALLLAMGSDYTSLAALNAYFIMSQEVNAAASHCAQALYWGDKEELDLLKSKSTRAELDTILVAEGTEKFPRMTYGATSEEINRAMGYSESRRKEEN